MKWNQLFPFETNQRTNRRSQAVCPSCVAFFWCLTSDFSLSPSINGKFLFTHDAAKGNTRKMIISKYSTIKCDLNSIHKIEKNLNH
jgi:hypothetical protein